MYDRIVKILIERDGMTEGDALELCEETAMEIQEAIDDADCSLSIVESIITCNLGLEPDYLDDFLI